MSYEQTNYWVVGAAFGGKEDVLEQFIKEGHWYCWDIDEDIKDSGKGNAVSVQRNRFRQIKKGDIIAVKKIINANEIKIRALGKVEDIDTEEWRVSVDWVQPDIQDRTVPSNGCIASIHGPFKYDDEWTKQVFGLKK